MKEKPKIKVALIGAGRAGMIHARNFKEMDGVEIVAIVDPDKEAAKAVCKELEIEKFYTDYQDVLDDLHINAVVVATPTQYHKSIVTDAAKAGKHILCEKPMAMTTEECDEMISAATKHSVILQLAFMRRFDDSYRQAKLVVDSGEIGDVVMVKSLTRGPSIPKPWMYDMKKSNGPLAEVNSHDIDTLRWFTGSEFTEVYALAGNYRCADARQEYPDFYDNVLLSAKFKNGCQGSIDGAQGVRYGYDARVEILGTKGVIYLGSTNADRLLVAGPQGILNRNYQKSWKNLFAQAYQKEDAHFVECIIRQKEPLVNGHDGKMAVQVVNAGNLSIRQNKIVTLF